ncbi:MULTISPECIES: hypothetical protein [unclassified Psychrobacter]|jgi:hypothetical protein|uniref:hypothetical protein n=1 Tax=unclassified Psychrobacter TaxID=196806 RepID=UPI000423809A|nr:MULTISPECIES: hypothetical protein [unclassified Psychrobacter]
MDKSEKNMDTEEQRIEKLADDINPKEDKSPDSLAEATTAPLDNDALGGTAKEDDLNKK